MSKPQNSIPLHSRHCQHRNSEADRLDADVVQSYLELINGWSLDDGNEVDSISKQIQVEDFDAALALALKLGNLADQQDHHPQLIIEWGKVKVSWWTHSVGGLSENDFIMAARVDQLINEN